DMSWFTHVCSSFVDRCLFYNVEYMGVMMSVNGKKRGRPRKGGDHLTDAAIIAAVRQQMFVEKKKITMRGLARRLDVDPMAIYHYFENKNALLEAVAVDVMDELYTPIGVESWETELEKLSLSYLTLLRGHPGLLEAMLRLLNDKRSNPAMVFRERFTRAIADLGLNAKTEQAALNLLVDYLHGVALAHQTSDERSQPDSEQFERTFALYTRSLKCDR
ncbi:MAG: TetR/AcrR family transcriptional regulator, partial [Chloroflexota bacterium]